MNIFCIKAFKNIITFIMGCGTYWMYYYIFEHKNPGQDDHTGRAALIGWADFTRRAACASKIRNLTVSMILNNLVKV